jgi:hypothetical protein
VTLLNFADEHYVVAFLMLWVICSSVLNLCNRIMRHWNIHKHGYPPPHCDADGDFPEESE